MNQFEDLTIRELRKLTEEYKEVNPNVQTAQQLLDELNTEDKKHMGISD